ncbi:MAG: sugar ABC transporter ATP-binding protein [Sphaerochaetaceae bacterium]|jgi:ribose transport system ATP-binding protein
MDAKKVLVSIKALTKRFPGIVALNNINLELLEGEVHILVGENGAGKSTLVKVLSGLYSQDEGYIKFRDVSYAPRDTREAINTGIRVIYQELSLIGTLTVAENIFFEQLPKKRGLLDSSTLNRKAQDLLERVGLDIAPDRPVRFLGIAQQQQVEIAKALAGKSQLIIMDEPTASLTSKESEKLFAIIKLLREQGKSIVYISHRLKEIFDIGDRVSIMRNGELVDTCDIREVTTEILVKKMVGRTIGKKIPFLESHNPDYSTPILSVEGLKRIGTDTSVSFSLYPGEILGIAGLVGSGRTEMIRALYGLDPKKCQSIKLNNKPIDIKSPRQAVKAGVGFLTEDRKDEGLLLTLSSSNNLTITDLKGIAKHGVLSAQVERTTAEKLIQDLQIKVQSYRQIVGTLSGGNQQKIVIGKWLYKRCEIFIFDEPTRGIDVGAKFEIYNLLWELAKKGKGIIVVSSEMEELIGLCHRILVMSKQEIVKEFTRDEFDQEKILRVSYKNYV